MKELSDAKTLYLSTKVAQCANDPKLLHRITDKLLVNQHQQMLPSDDDHIHLANAFGSFSLIMATTIEEWSPPRFSVRGKSLLYVCLSHVRYS